MRELRNNAQNRVLFGCHVGKIHIGLVTRSAKCWCYVHSTICSCAFHCFLITISHRTSLLDLFLVKPGRRFCMLTRKKERFWRGSNSRPSACKADVITTTPQNQTWHRWSKRVTVPRPQSIFIVGYTNYRV